MTALSHPLFYGHPRGPKGQILDQVSPAAVAYRLGNSVPIWEESQEPQIPSVAARQVTRTND